MQAAITRVPPDLTGTIRLTGKLLYACSAHNVFAQSAVNFPNNKLQQVEQLLRRRRSIRNYKDKPVERDKLAKILEIACFAPSAKNNQPWHWTVVEDPAQTRRFAGMVIDWMRTVTQQHPEQAELRGFPRVVSAWDAGEE